MQWMKMEVRRTNGFAIGNSIGRAAEKTCTPGTTLIGRLAERPPNASSRCKNDEQKDRGTHGETRNDAPSQSLSPASAHHNALRVVSPNLNKSAGSPVNFVTAGPHLFQSRVGAAGCAPIINHATIVSFFATGSWASRGCSFRCRCGLPLAQSQEPRQRKAIRLQQFSLERLPTMQNATHYARIRRGIGVRDEWKTGSQYTPRPKMVLRSV
jgi:hypothetical protein